MIIIIMVWSEEDFHKIRARDPEIFGRVYKEYKKNIYNYLIVKVNGNKGIAEDLFSDTFHSAFISAPQLKNINSISSWLLQIANRRFYDYLRKNYRNKKYFDEINEEDISSNEDFTQKLEIKEKVIAIQIALENIKPHYNKVLLLKYEEHKSLKDISKIINKSESSVQNLIFKAKNALKKELNKLRRDF